MCASELSNSIKHTVVMPTQTAMLQFLTRLHFVCILGIWYTLLNLGPLLPQMVSIRPELFSTGWPVWYEITCLLIYPRHLCTHGREILESKSDMTEEDDCQGLSKCHQPTWMLESITSINILCLMLNAVQLLSLIGLRHKNSWSGLGRDGGLC